MLYFKIIYINKTFPEKIWQPSLLHEWRHRSTNRASVIPPLGSANFLD